MTSSSLATYVCTSMFVLCHVIFVVSHSCRTFMGFQCITCDYAVTMSCHRRCFSIFLLSLLFIRGYSQSSTQRQGQVVLPTPEDILDCFLTDYLTEIVSECSTYFSANGTGSGLNSILRAAVSSCLSDMSNVNKVGVSAHL